MQLRGSRQQSAAVFITAVICVYARACHNDGAPVSPKAAAVDSASSTQPATNPWIAKSETTGTRRKDYLEFRLPDEFWQQVGEREDFTLLLSELSPFRISGEGTSNSSFSFAGVSKSHQFWLAARETDTATAKPGEQYLKFPGDAKDLSGKLILMRDGRIVGDLPFVVRVRTTTPVPFINARRAGDDTVIQFGAFVPVPAPQRAGGAAE